MNHDLVDDQYMGLRGVEVIIFLVWLKFMSLLLPFAFKDFYSAECSDRSKSKSCAGQWISYYQFSIICQCLVIWIVHSSCSGQLIHSPVLSCVATLLNIQISACYFLLLTHKVLINRQECIHMQMSRSPTTHLISLTMLTWNAAIW